MDIKKLIKNNLKKGSLFRRYFFSTALIVLVSLVSICIIMMVFIATQWWNEKINNLTVNAQDIVSVIKDMENDESNGEIKMSKNKLLATTLEVMSRATASDYFVVDSNGHILLCKEMGESKRGIDNCAIHSEMYIPEKYMQRALSNGFSDYATDDLFGLGNFIVAVPVSFQTQQYAVFAVEDAITGLVPYILSILKILLISVFVSLLVCFIAIYYVCRSITTPLSEMQEVTKHFAKGEFEHRASSEYKTEYLRDFAKSLNKMADELAIEEESQRSFVANVSHELKTPMTTISGFIDGILDGTIPPEQQKSYLTTVSNEVKRLSRMVVAMLNLSKIEAGKVNLTRIKYDVSAQIFETLLLFEKKIEEKNIDIVGFEDIGNVTINADKDLIKQVIFNLIDNAVKFTPENGTITVFAKNEDGKTTVQIKNSGKGVPNEEISRLFERFYKTDKSRSYDVKGVGLGLYIVKTVVNMHDGEIAASSVENEYTQFTFEIPN